MLDQVRQAAGKNALVPPQIGAALGAAQMRMQEAREAISSASPNSREAADQAGGAVDGLNAAAHQLLRARGDVSGSQSGSGLAEALERLAQLAQQQGGLGQQGAGMLPMAGSGAIREQLQRLAARQRALAQELEKLRGREAFPERATWPMRLPSFPASWKEDGWSVRPSRDSSGCSAGCSMPEELSRAGRRTRKRSGRAPPPPATASIFRRRCGLAWRMRTGG